ncbi:glycosyltransferase family 2 protein [Paenibacillus guangzhouensis]|uniref:glycosyltransferase family 2 protein n=1 Tax=Paenibacillus guangzhouensis TaxID=1473112 RepID=UPI0012671429|nr:glycosyltransferase family 2 protein [Paenibacillus guangzhouensis]
MKYIVVIPWRNDIQLLQQAIHSIPSYWKYTVIIDNSPERNLQHVRNSFPPGVQIYEPPIPLTFTQSMNYMLRLAKKLYCDIAIYMQHDAEAHLETPDFFLSILEQLIHSKTRWGIAFTNGDTLAAINMAAVETVGLWDTTFPLYYSDCDYFYRMRLANYELIWTHLPVIHHNGGSSTIKSDSYLTAWNKATWPIYSQLFRLKWGGEPWKETFITPFNA